MKKKINIIMIACITCGALTSVAQKQTIKPDLSNKSHFQVVNREITISGNDPGKIIMHLDGKPGDGLAWINNTTFKSGVIEFDAKGKNIMQQSFLGIAFHGLNDSTFDAVYFRPFNFQSPDTARRGHSVQYVSLPQFDWSILRQNHPGKYENALLNPVDAESWFHAKIVIENDNIIVYVNKDAKPSLVVQPLSGRAIGKIGFWVGNNSDGDFANLIITQ
ncbi:MAG TPA: hypothetical protein VGG71_13895 [Chitinophagaceae bacterium]